MLGRRLLSFRVKVNKSSRLTKLTTHESTLHPPAEETHTSTTAFGSHQIFDARTLRAFLYFDSTSWAANNCSIISDLQPSRKCIMARLNDTANPSDRPSDSNLDALRRRFLRQNRDIARQNSTQGLKIRQLEFEVQRLLTENLEMRSQMYRLENELQESKARRIADHALEIRAKMLHHVQEFTDIINSLGTEPPRKRRMSPASRAISRLRQSTSTSPSHETRPRKSKEVRREAEELAEREGRLPPIFETKIYPRRTMDGNEILALCAEAAEEEQEVDEAANSSAEIGPAPTSQFIEEEPVKTDSQYQPSPIRENATLDVQSAKRNLPANSPSPKQELEPTLSDATSPVKPTNRIDFEASANGKTTTKLNSTVTPITNDATLKPTPEPSSPSPAPVVRTAHVPAPAPAPSKGKRKFDVREDESRAVARAGKVLSEKPPLANQDKNRRKPIKTLSSLKNRERLAPSPRNGMIERKVLGVKNANQEIQSPMKKPTKPAAFDEVAAEKADALRAATAKEAKGKSKAKGKKETAPVSIPIPELVVPAVNTIEPDAAEPSPITESLPEHPASPAPSLPAGARDTPPPGDISHNGEAARPSSRRARAQVSYAEPNLRDKMRRPSKQLVDAVTGESKYTHRTSIKANELHPSAPSSASTQHSSIGKDGSNKQASVDDTHQIERQKEASKSPLSGKCIVVQMLAQCEMDPESNGNSHELLQPLPAPQEDKFLPSPVEPENQAADPYDFTPSSPSSTEHTSLLSNGSSNAEDDATNKQGVSVRAKPRRASAMKVDYSDMDDEDDIRPSKSQGGRKRVSMIAPRRQRSDMDSGYDSGAAAGALGSAGHSAAGSHSRGSGRRRSMMI
ncbi:hypothetical protein MKZ38_001958 [Zalerion maritima]|uniref:Shugoshin n=1 Tax=Zalerion maritima TaxID=339359 RepID=A0AAD5WTH1_9PEZI|nr:hypothetical protein MKZ38_001958 [Zalerion maritima]